jgi:hypothetical protein
MELGKWPGEMVLTRTFSSAKRLAITEERKIRPDLLAT